MQSILIKDAFVINEEKTEKKDVLINHEFIEKIDKEINPDKADYVIDGTGKYLIPGIIDDQVHFREPGLTHKAQIYTEAKAAVAGGVTSFMEMPNTNPPATSIERLEQKYAIAEENSLANYSFYIGVATDEHTDCMKINPKNVCGIKIFLGSSTGNMLVNNEEVLRTVMENAPTIIAVHSENDKIIEKNLEEAKQKYGEDIPIEEHANIRSKEACYDKTQYITNLAQKTGCHLHVLHLTTAEELEFFTRKGDIEDKNITSEVCVHHLWFDSKDYAKLGTRIKCNPSIKEKSNKEALFKALLNDQIDVIATDHAPHTLEEKNNKYLKAPSGLPLIQHSLNVMLEFYHQNRISLEKIVEKMAHHPARLFQIEKRGFIREGYYADLALVDLEHTWQVKQGNILYKCKWSPFEGEIFKGKVTHTLVSGNLAYENGIFYEKVKGKRLTFDR